MAIAPLETSGDPDVSLGSVYAALVQMADSLTVQGRMLARTEVVQTLVDVEDISRVVDYLQVFAAGMAEERDLASGDEPRDAGSLQARAAQSLRTSGTVDGAQSETSGDGAVDDAGGTRFRSCVDYLRARLGISRAEAKRRLDLARSVLPGTAPSGSFLEPQSAAVSAAFASGTLSGRAATAICSAVERVRCLAAPEHLVSMEHHLTRQALESDEDVLRVVARRWETVLDQDGQEPTEKILRSRQGVFIRGRRNGLRILEIGATDEQFEHLVTAMTTVTNPRTPTNRTPDEPHRLSSTEALAERSDGESSPAVQERPTRAQSLLDGLVGACRIALSSSGLPATGGHRPQVMVTIDYRDLLADIRDARGSGDVRTTGGRRTNHPEAIAPGIIDPRVRGRDIDGRRAFADAFAGSRTVGTGSGRAVFAEQLSARSIRRIACDADLIPLVLGGEGQILDIGRAGRLFPPHMRRALVARDRGCAFPDCTIPATWCEAHHMMPWSRGDTTGITNGVLLCAHHHHTIHDGLWTVTSHNGIPWFTPPPHLGRHGNSTRRNRYWHAQPGTPAGAMGPAPSGGR
ncbi:HNH endonuclease [Arthrobacter pityocampae]|uniref:HNH endonuclease n=1 Tax=Arthrobacter pityocampae TaxID=547334 RepID=A0A2S5IWN8_9MICC|nr:HNH endonuclease signature motif containing protein [Arthrobacter pityocampae]PPB48964.1 HNH endonuclease [Arthrobacter pityocampae]